MIASRSLSLSEAHCAISASVRPQPWQSPERGSMVQTLVQGEEIGIARAIGESPRTIRVRSRNAMRHALRAVGWRAGGSCAGWIGGEGA